MKAYEIQGSFGLESLQQVERPEPSPGERQVLMRVRAVSLNFRDLLVIRGLYNPRLKLPLIPCSDGAGEVVAVGPGVTRVQPGDRVTATFFQGWNEGEPSDAKVRDALGGGIDGILCQYRVLHEDGLVHTPGHLSDLEAATLPCAALTAWNALFEQTSVKPGQTVLTLGTGGVSLFALQFARIAGARVIITSSRDDKLARAQQLGAEHGVNYVTDSNWEDRARELSGGEGVDHVIELGGAGTLGKSLKAVKRGGIVSLIGVLSGPAGEVNPISILMKGVRVQGIYVGSRAMFQNMNRAISQHAVRPVVDRVFPFSEARQALDHMAGGNHFGKIVVQVD